MDYKKIKGVVRILIIVWILFFAYLYELTDTRNLFEYLTYLFIGLYLSFDIKTDWKYILLILLTWNVADELAAIFINETFKLIVFLPIAFFVYRKVVKLVECLRKKEMCIDNIYKKHIRS